MRKSLLMLLFCFMAVSITASVGAASETIRTVQQALTDKGMDPGPVDGLMGAKTRQAIRDFQKKQNLEETGRLNKETQRALEIDVPTTVTIPAGTRIQVFLADPLSTKTNNQGDRFQMTVSSSVQASGEVAVPRRAVISGSIKELERAQRPQKAGRLVLSARTLVVLGESVELEGMIMADEARLKGRGSAKQDWKKIGLAAGVGAIIGGVAGGGKGVAAGLAIGGGGVFLATKGEHVNLPSETPLIVELAQEIVVPIL